MKAVMVMIPASTKSAKDKKLLFQRGQIENSGLCIGFSPTYGNVK
jgi:hypothetical protein